ncbi:MAG: metal ABC transporter ATP-binding protein [Planctomycetota bacterium]|nr:metal ABC transporter ATP-binding protein [Planctomycetota bacterium]MCX8039494.1 metal ABC transporter ATP-binding protein [Planctomycetota bacterium]MDW8373012.1 metal ABC transporter ATP-binding protein [Planctomycetota bacterium]
MSGAHHDHLVLDDVTICYRRRPAVHHVSCALPCGSLVALVGPNGAGKSTLLAGILGWLPLTTGRIVWNGHELRGRPQFVGWLGQRRQQHGSFPIDVASVVAMGRYGQVGWWRGFTADDRTAVTQAMATMGIAHLADRAFHELSGGEQQRVLLARALAGGAEVLLLDEPLTGLDAVAVRDVLERLQAWVRGGRLVLLVLHDLAIVRAWCPYTVLLRRELIAAGPTATVLTEAQLARCYGRRFVEGGAAHG